MSNKNSAEKTAKATKATEQKVNDATATATPAAPIAAPVKTAMVFKVGKRQLPTGKRGGGGKRGSKYTDGSMLKFATAPYAAVEKSGGKLMHILEGNGIILYPHVSGKYADHNNVISEVVAEGAPQTFENYEAAVAARQIIFAHKEGENFLGFINNAKLPEGYKTDKNQAYHGFLMAETAADIETAVNNLAAWNQIPGAELFQADKDLVFITDADGNIEATPLKVVAETAQAATIPMAPASTEGAEA